MKQFLMKKPFKKHKNNLDYAKFTLKNLIDKKNINYAIIFVHTGKGVNYFWRTKEEKGQGYIKNEKELYEFLLDKWGKRGFISG